MDECPLKWFLSQITQCSKDTKVILKFLSKDKNQDKNRPSGTVGQYTDYHFLRWTRRKVCLCCLLGMLCCQNSFVISNSILNCFLESNDVNVYLAFQRDSHYKILV